MYQRSLIWVTTILAVLSVTLSQEADYRLPKEVVPDVYTLKIKTVLNDEENPFTFSGGVTIRLNVLSNTKNITLHSADLEILEPNVTLTKYIHEKDRKDDTEFQKIQIVKHSYDTENEFYRVDLSEEITPGTRYYLTIPFKGNLTEGLAGYYRSKYTDRETGETKWLAVTQFESTDARRAFPCFDEPEFKAQFTIRLEHSPNYTSLSNMPLDRSETQNGNVIDIYKDSVKMSTYLVAFMVSDFDFKFGVKDDPKHNILFKIWARKDALDQTGFAAMVGPKYLAFYEDFFNIKYPLPKQDMVAIPDFAAGAMENWGLITYRETALLFDPNISAASSQHRVASVVAHELAHQWFGNLVTMKWWTDLWLNEGFATYMAAKAVHYINPEWNSFNEENVENMLQVYQLDSMVSSHPISIQIGHPSEIAQIFDTISYKKGALILRMMDLFLGEEVFRQGLSNYLKKYAYGNAEQNDLWNSLTEEAHAQNVLDKNVTVKAIMDTWTVQTGYPLVTVTRNYEDNTGTVTQKRFFKGLYDTKSVDNQCWWIPLSYTTSSEKNFNSTKPKAWFECDEQGGKVETVINLPAKREDWVLFNIQSSGLYKLNYDVQNWELLINTLLENSGAIPVLNRVQLIDDSLDLAAAGHLDYSISLKLLTYLVTETEYLAWNAAFQHLGTLNTMLRRKPAYGVFKKYMKKIITPIYEKVAYELPTDKTADTIKRQVLISAWACRFNVGDCQMQSKELFQEWMKAPNPDETNPIPKDLRSVVFCTALRSGDQDEWDFLWNRYLNSNVGSEKITILSSLGCSEQIWLLNRYLDWSLNSTSGIRKQDIVYVYTSVASSSVGYFLAKDFLKTQLGAINEYLGSKTDRKVALRYIKALAKSMIHKGELEELELFVQSQSDSLKRAKIGIEQAIEKVKLNIQWQERHYDRISELLTTLAA